MEVGYSFGLGLFNNSSNSKIGHVGIYIGSNTFLHAANAKKGVITTSLSDLVFLEISLTINLPNPLIVIISFGFTLLEFLLTTS